MISKKKILLLNHGLANGGTDTFVINVLRGLDNAKYETGIILAVDSNSAPQFREADVHSMGIPIYKTSDLDSPKKVLRHGYRLYKILCQEKPDVFHANMDLFNGVNMFVAWLAGVPIRVCHSHNSQSQYEANTGRTLIVSLYRSIMRQLLWIFSNRRCGCSNLAMDYLFTNKWKTDKNSSVIYNGINIERYNSHINRNKKLNELGLPSNIHYLLAVGRLAAQKNPLYIVDIMDNVCQKRDDVMLLWVGTGEMEPAIRQRIASYGLNSKIHLLGARKDVSEILQCGDIFLMPSLFEGLPISLIEAQAANLVCVVSDSITNQVNAGKCIFLPIDNSTDIWSEKVLEILDSGSDAEIDPNLLKQFDINYMIRQVEEIYK